VQDRSSAIAIAAPNEAAVAAGVRLSAEGGNAVDAALAAVLVAAVTEPGVVSAAGGAFVTISSADGSPAVTVDGNVEMPGRGVPPERFGRGVRDVTCGYGGGVTMTVGHGSVATPGALAGLDLAHSRYGQAPWQEVVAPAVETARAGFPLGHASHHYLEYTHLSVFGTDPDSHASLHHDDGALLGVGETVRVAGLADTLGLIAAEGAKAFYTGDLARSIAADMAANDGILTEQDLADYRPVVRRALPVGVGGWQLDTNPTPAVGGVVLAAMLVLLDGRPAGPWQAADLRHLVDVQRAVLAHRSERLDVAEDRVEEAERLLQLASRRDLARMHTAPNTVHVSVVDATGNACAVTSSAGYGSGVMVPGTGLWLNNCLGEQELNRGGLHTSTPGERLLSNMAPTVGRTADGAVLAAGSPGADRITTALAQVLAGIANGGLSLPEAINHPRLHVRDAATQPRVDYEEDLDLPPVDLQTQAYPASSMYFGGVTVAKREADGTLLAAGDPRRTAAVAVTEA
jgi:gamma-glutamyltranspeptidase/glutathione hydrolase